MTLDRAVRDDVTDVLIAYASGIDGRDWKLLWSCFTEDCDADYGAIGHWTSADEITDWMARTHDPLGPTLHRITNIALAGDAAGVGARSYVHAIVPNPEANTTVHAYGYYDDKLVPVGGRWKIAQRRFTPVSTDIRTSGG